MLLYVVTPARKNGSSQLFGVEIINQIKSEILACCDPREIESEIDESKSVTAKIIEVKAKIESVKKANTTGISHGPAVSGHESISLSMTKHAFQSSHFPFSEVMSLDGFPCGIPTILPSTATHSCRR